MTQTPAADLGAVLERLTQTIRARKGQDPNASYVAKLLAKGSSHCAKKMGEEAVETALAAVQTKQDGPQPVVSESADLLFHLLVLWEAAGIEPEAVAAELARREGLSGLTEKAQRTE